MGTTWPEHMSGIDRIRHTGRYRVYCYDQHVYGDDIMVMPKAALGIVVVLIITIAKPMPLTRPQHMSGLDRINGMSCVVVTITINTHVLNTGPPHATGIYGSSDRGHRCFYYHDQIAISITTC